MEKDFNLKMFLKKMLFHDIARCIYIFICKNISEGSSVKRSKEYICIFTEDKSFYLIKTKPFEQKNH